jgi:hypothetical protein
MGRMNAKAANAIIEFSNEFLKDAPIDVARIRIALAMLLNTSDNSDDRKRAADLYNLNLETDDNTRGPEKFYSYVGFAEYYYSPITEDETQDASKTRWENVVKKPIWHSNNAKTRKRHSVLNWITNVVPELSG